MNRLNAKTCERAGGTYALLLTFGLLISAHANLALATPIPQASDRLSDAPQSIFLQNATIIDGTGAEPIERGWIRIDKGRIAAVGRGAAPVSPGSRVLDLEGRSVYPGLSDMHTHIGRLAQAKWMLKLFLVNGITNIKVAGNWTDPKTGVHHDTEIRQWLRSEGDVPHVYMSGTTMAGQSRYAPPDFKAVYLPAGPQMQKFLDDNLSMGVDFFKSYDSIEPDALRQAGAFAKAHNIYLTGHVPDAMTSVEAIDGGLVIIEHLIIRGQEVSPSAAGDTSYENFWTDADLNSPTIKHTLDEWTARKDRFFIDPTLVVSYAGDVLRKLFPPPQKTSSDDVVSPAMLRQRAAGDDPAGGPAKKPPSAAQKAAAARNLRNRAQFLAMAYGRGVRILTGTDMPLARMAAGESLLEELDLLASGGLTPIQVIHASTGTAADAFRRKDRGIIAPGQVADLVIVKGDVTKDLHATRNVEHVILGGRILDPKKLMKEARALAAADTQYLPPGEP